MVNDNEVREEQGEAQAIEGYGCICGFKTEDKKELERHFLSAGRRDGKGIHKSLGRINLQTGEVILPPWSERSDEQKSGSRYAKKSGKKSGAERVIGQTEILSDAQLLKFVPRIFTTDYTPIMRMARDVAVNKWGWRADMPLQNLIDTIFYHFFEDRGYTLAGYIISEEAQRELEEIEAKKTEEVK